MPARIAPAVLAALILSPPALAQTAADGQAAADALVAGDTAPLWPQMTPDLQDLFGSPAGLAAFAGGLRKALGDEVEVLSRETVQQGAMVVHERLSRWTGAAVPLQVVVTVDETGRIAGLLAQPQPQPADSPHLDYQTRTRLRLPLQGDWHVYWGGRSVSDNYHAADPGQRFALDLLVMRDGASHAGDPADLASYHCWDQPVLAPADGKVLQAVGNLPDQPIGQTDPGNPAGNHVVIDFGPGHYFRQREIGFLAHLRQDSVTVAPGDMVTAGQEIGRCGNSGNSSEPHLHFHLQDGPLLGRGLGLPAQFLDYMADGVPVERGEPLRGQTIRLAP